MKTFQEFNENKEKMVKAFLAKRDAAPKNFWAFTKEASDFFAYWDRKWEIMQKHFDKQFKKVYLLEGFC